MKPLLNCISNRELIRNAFLIPHFTITSNKQTVKERGKEINDTAFSITLLKKTISKRLETKTGVPVRPEIIKIMDITRIYRVFENFPDKDGFVLNF